MVPDADADHLDFDASVHAEAIASLAKETHTPIPVVKRVYEAEYARLNAFANNKDYLVVFAVRRTRDALRRTFG
jgi:hypothetical protein